MTQEEIDKMQSRLLALEEKTQVLDLFQLEAEYARRWDFGDGEQWAAVFTPDGVFEMAEIRNVAPLPGSGEMRLEGRDALAAYRNSFSAEWHFLHLFHLSSFRVRGDRAESVVFFESPVKATDEEGRAMFVRMTGVYRVDYRLTAEGWRMAKRIELPITNDMLTKFRPHVLPEFTI